MKTRSENRVKAGSKMRPARSENSRSIELHIGQLVLHGFAHPDRRVIAESIARELRTLLTNEDFANATSFTADRINGETFQLSHNRQRESAGENIARAIYGGLRP